MRLQAGGKIAVHHGMVYDELFIAVVANPDNLSSAEQNDAYNSAATKFGSYIVFVQGKPDRSMVHYCRI